MEADLSRGIARANTVTVEVLPLLRANETDRLTIAEGLQRNRGDHPVESLLRRHALTHKAPAVSVGVGRLEGLPGSESHVVLRPEREPRERGEQEHDTRV